MDWIQFKYDSSKRKIGTGNKAMSVPYWQPLYSFTWNLGWVTINSSKIIARAARMPYNPVSKFTHATQKRSLKQKQNKRNKEKSEHVNSYDSLEERHVFGYKTTSTPSKNLTQVPSLAFKFCSKQFFLSRYPLLLYLPFCFSHQISSFDWHYYLFDSLDSSQVRISLIWHMIINFMH